MSLPQVLPPSWKIACAEIPRASLLQCEPRPDELRRILHHQNQSWLPGVPAPALAQIYDPQVKNATSAVLDHRLFGAFLWTYWLTLFPSRKSMREAELLCIMTVSLIEA